MFTNLIFLVLENFTNSDRTPPYIDRYLQLCPNFGNFGRSPIRMNLSLKEKVERAHNISAKKSWYANAASLGSWDNTSPGANFRGNFLRKNTHREKARAPSEKWRVFGKNNRVVSANASLSVRAHTFVGKRSASKFVQEGLLSSQPVGWW